MTSWEGGLLLWVALCLLGGALILLVASVGSQPLGDDEHDERP